MRALLLLITVQPLLGIALQLESKQSRVSVQRNLSKIAKKVPGLNGKNDYLLFELEKVRMIEQRMREISEGDKLLVERVCKGFSDEEDCAANAMLYIERCKRGGCMKLNYEKQPLKEDDQPIALPNIYQLETAYYIFGLVLKDYRIDNGIARLKLSSKSKSNFYRIFMAALVRSNLSFSAQFRQHINAFLTRYLYMATLYYKTYTSMERIKTMLQNYIGSRNSWFEKRIRRVLKRIVMINRKDYDKTIDARYIVNMTVDFRQYMLNLQRNHAVFAALYSKIVVETLIHTAGELAEKSRQSVFRRASEGAKNAFEKLSWRSLNPFTALKRWVTGMNTHDIVKPFDEFVEAANDLD
ncbi:RAP-1 related antigen (RRA) [Babesia divergens]|uniref:RAP-1 related antigen (RRA) n=1 Tax=Babesia divergens TaxID=32595 RepID=A0AAD9GDW4_BABDI|nr:RAP-1 related antigen (RRA) [Babesia divergens]